MNDDVSSLSSKQELVVSQNLQPGVLVQDTYLESESLCLFVVELEMMIRRDINIVKQTKDLEANSRPAHTNEPPLDIHHGRRQNKLSFQTNRIPYKDH